MKDLNIKQWESTFTNKGELGVEVDVWRFVAAEKAGKEAPAFPDVTMINEARAGLHVIDRHAAKGTLLSLANEIWDRLPHPIELERQRRQFQKKAPTYKAWLSLIALLNGSDSEAKGDAERAARDYLDFERKADGGPVTMNDFGVHPSRAESLMRLMPAFVPKKKSGPKDTVPWGKSADAMDAMRRAAFQGVPITEAARTYALAEGKQDNAERRGEYLAELYRKKMSIRAPQ
ncbi:hypothetical protein [Sulfitobacter sp.]|uniref:hypothetical protein n=1 Tax=Sulfitobacter sp. TaxID=1903071 RepID=UPI0039E2D0EE